MTAKEDLHREFQERMLASEPYRWAAAQVLVQRGHTIEVPPMTISPTYEDRFKHSDKGDLFVTRKGERHVICVKSSTRIWHDASDWPFEDYMVGSVHEMRLKPIWVLNFNKDKTAYGMVCWDSQPSWEIIERTQGYKNAPGKMGKERI